MNPDPLSWWTGCGPGRAGPGRAGPGWAESMGLLRFVELNLLNSECIFYICVKSLSSLSVSLCIFITKYSPCCEISGLEDSGLGLGFEHKPNVMWTVFERTSKAGVFRADDAFLWCISDLWPLSPDCPNVLSEVAKKKQDSHLFNNNSSVCSYLISLSLSLSHTHTHSIVFVIAVEFLITGLDPRQ